MTIKNPNAAAEGDPMSTVKPMTAEQRAEYEKRFQQDLTPVNLGSFTMSDADIELEKRTSHARRNDIRYRTLLDGAGKE